MKDKISERRYGSPGVKTMSGSAYNRSPMLFLCVGTQLTTKKEAYDNAKSKCYSMNGTVKTYGKSSDSDCYGMNGDCHCQATAQIKCQVDY